METPDRNSPLWQQAKCRARFKIHLSTYLGVNALLWLLWALLPHPARVLPWPAFPTLFWGLGLIRHGVAAYDGFNLEQRTRQEYEQLLRARAGRQNS